MFKKLYEAEYGQLGGEPYGCIIADYYFDHTPPDVDLLGSIAKVAASAHAPFIAGASPRYCKWTLAGTGESPRPDQNRHPEHGICAVELAAG